ncbi:MAG TPA: Crp/Fnr family transcriptional regulator [Acidimicrobiales bacterium]|nr:Crp/Fnr family transcriptional regulator [Acidimicrobiales bacterium]
MDWPLFAGLKEETRRDVLARTRRRRFDRKQALFYEGDPSDGMHLVASGWVAVRVSTPLGDVATVAVVGPQEPLGEQSLLGDHDRRSASAIALSPVESLYLSRTDFDELREFDPSVDRFLAGLFNDRLRRTSARLLEALYIPTPQRVLRRLTEVAETFGDDGVIPLTQEDMATLAGTTRPTVNRTLRKAEEAGALSLARGRIRILDVSVLARLAH